MGDARTRVDFSKVCIQQVDLPFPTDEDFLSTSSTIDSYDSEEDLTSSCSDSDESVELNGDTPLVFLDTETNGLFDEDDQLYVPEMLQICLKYKNRTFNRYIQPTSDIEDEASYVNGLTIINGRLYRHGNEVTTVGLSECLHSLLLWLNEVKESAGGRKPILIAHHGFGFHFKILCHTFDMCNLREGAYEVIGGFADTLDLARKFISQDSVRNYQLRSLAMRLFNMHVPNEAKAQAMAVQKIFMNHLSEHFNAEEVYTYNNFCNSVI